MIRYIVLVIQSLKFSHCSADAGHKVFELFHRDFFLVLNSRRYI